MSKETALLKLAELSAKFAAPDQEFEQGFFQLAFDKLQSKLYNLIPYLVGFELVKKSDDGAKAIGVFGFKSDNGQIIFVPAFFINGKVKDLDVMYSRNNNQFYPLNEDFAELFLKNDTTGMGSVSADKRKDIEKDIAPVNYRDLVLPPRTSKISYASVIDYISESDNNVKKAAWGIMEKNAGFTESLRYFYSDEQIAKAFVPKLAEAIPTRKLKTLDIVKFAEADSIEGLTSEDKVKVTTAGYAIIDKRAEENKSRFGQFQLTEVFTNPDEPGFYSYVTELGTIRYGLVLIKPAHLHKAFCSESSIVIDLEANKSGQAYFVNDSEIFIRNQIKVQDYSSVHKMMEEPAEALPSFSDTYILINESLRASQPFRVTQNFKDSSGVRRLIVEPDAYYNSPYPMAPSAITRNDNAKFDNRFEKDITPLEVTLVFTKKVSDKFEHKGNITYVPKGYKLLKIHTHFDHCCSMDSNETSAQRKKRQAEEKAEELHIKQGRPGKLYHVNALLNTQGIYPIVVNTNGSEYFVNIGKAKKKYSNPVEAKIGMVMDIGLDEKNAEEIISGLLSDMAIEGYIKTAYTGDYTLPLQDEAPYANELGQSTYSGIPYQNSATNDQTYQGNPTQIGLGETDPNSGSANPTSGPNTNKGLDGEVDNAVGLAQNGQKEIFDTQAIATISKYVDPTNKVITYIPNFVDSLDKLGRMLFMIYWETKKFQEMYGHDELPELIELLKNVFKNLGDLIIFLKRKFPDISINNNEQASDSV